ncbi:MAG: imidazole glycerol phosphate synthase subunit HisF [Bacteroidetes bacterium GWF2_33_16]|nr:MAG: imidazole glycerol phosphate synthase subunit HisF [Bacteroidetes bacterium GWE2_32_14]OFY02973.1 MAG: imidazole glycerol phosphate synthase subunit HisF [Bacteroidetes bacterium GWF2_33_16]
MLAKRIIPCLDIKDGQTVKGIEFESLKNVGDPVELGKYYSDNGADELVFLDITATHEKRKTLIELVKRIAKEINIPFTVGGGISSVEDADAILSAGADKISVNSAAINNPKLISEIAQKFGSQFIVLAIDAKLENNQWIVYKNGGRIKTSLELYSWAKHAESLGCGEILFTSMNHDGTKNGFALEPLKWLTENLNIPLIASGGAGSIKDFEDLFLHTNVEAALAASIFHYKEIEISYLKRVLSQNKIEVRI